MRQRRLPTEINAGSMADIAFLLLIFFLVATTIMKDKGIHTVLPAYYEGPPGKMADRQVCDIKINAKSELLVEGEVIDMYDLRAFVMEFVMNPLQRNDMPLDPKDAVISLSHDSQTPYKTYLSVYNEIKSAYREIRNQDAIKKYGVAYDKCSIQQRNSIIQNLPIKISEADPFYSQN